MLAGPVSPDSAVVDPWCAVEAERQAGLTRAGDGDVRRSRATVNHSEGFKYEVWLTSEPMPLWRDRGRVVAVCKKARKLTKCC